MTGEEIYNLLNKMASRGDSPRKRERQLRKLAEKEGLSSDALRAKARRFAKKDGSTYPLMRKPAAENREEERERRRSARGAQREERLKAGAEALAKGADWSALAVIFGIKTPEGAAQWWKRNHDGAPAAKRSTKKRRRQSAAKPAPTA